jgi:Cytochrome c
MSKKRKKFKKFLKYFFLTIIFLLISGYIYFSITYPKTKPAPRVEIYPTQNRLERGSYLVNHVTVCLTCHSSRDWTKFSGPVIKGTEGMGGEKFNEGIPGTLYAGNITPSGIGEWTNGEVLRTITTGVTKANRVLFPLMPYLEYHQLTQEDLYSIITYIKTLEPIVHEVPQSNIDFPMNFIIKTIPPEMYIPISNIDENNPAVYGKYLVDIAACRSCHTPMKNGELIKEMNFAGGIVFNTNGGIIRSSNITPDIETGIGRWTQEDFIKKFRLYPEDYKNIKIKPGEFNTPMPWSEYEGMTDTDLKDIYDYLKTVPPVHNKVEKFTALKKK